MVSRYPGIGRGGITLIKGGTSKEKEEFGIAKVVDVCGETNVMVWVFPADRLEYTKEKEMVPKEKVEEVIFMSESFATIVEKLCVDIQRSTGVTVIWRARVRVMLLLIKELTVKTRGWL